MSTQAKRAHIAIRLVFGAQTAHLNTSHHFYGRDFTPRDAQGQVQVQGERRGGARSSTLLAADPLTGITPSS